MPTKQRRTTPKCINFSAGEIEKARERFEFELVTDTSSCSLFNVGILSILEGAEKRRTAELAAMKLIDLGFESPKDILEHEHEIPEVLSQTRWYNVRAGRVIGFSEWWASGNQMPMVIQDIVHDVSNGKSKGLELRDSFAGQAAGIERKTASVFMMRLGYENLVPIDTHECKLLRKIGFDIKVPDYKTQGLPRGKKYLECERKVVELARGIGITPAVFHHAVLNRGSRSRNKSA